MEMSSSLKERGGRIKEEWLDDDDEGCLKLFGEKVSSSTRNGDDHGGDDDGDKPIINNSNKNKVVGGEKSSKVVEMRSYSRGLKQFLMMNHRRRQASVLERQILPGIISRSSSPGGKVGVGDQCSKAISSQPQLTIFYSGMVNVFDNISPEKVEAMVLLARESCKSKGKQSEVVVHNNNNNESTKLKDKPLPSPDGSRFRLPVARKISLQHFMEKRRFRITSKSPYNNYPPPPPPNIPKLIGDEEAEEEEDKSKNVMNGGGSDDDDDPIISLSPFPSSSRYFLSLTPAAPAADEDCQNMS